MMRLLHGDSSTCMMGEEKGMLYSQRDSWSLVRRMNG